jgi:hypothetical protein
MTEKIDFDVQIPKLRSYAIELANLALDILKQAKHQEYDHLKFMTSTFVCKQLSHIKSVVALADSEQYKDALSIARVWQKAMLYYYGQVQNPQSAHSIGELMF